MRARRRSRCRRRARRASRTLRTASSSTCRAQDVVDAALHVARRAWSRTLRAALDSSRARGAARAPRAAARSAARLRARAPRARRIASHAGGDSACVASRQARAATASALALGARSSAASSRGLRVARAPCGRAVEEAARRGAATPTSSPRKRDAGSGTPRGSAPSSSSSRARARARIWRSFCQAARPPRRARRLGSSCAASCIVSVLAPRRSPRATSRSAAPPSARRSTPGCEKKRRSSTARIAVATAGDSSSSGVHAEPALARGSTRRSWSTRAVPVEQHRLARPRCAARTASKAGGAGQARASRARRAATRRRPAQRERSVLASRRHLELQRSAAPPKRSGAYIASTRVGGSSKRPSGSRRSVYSMRDVSLRHELVVARARVLELRSVKARPGAPPAVALRLLALRRERGVAAEAAAEDARAGRDADRSTTTHAASALRLDVEVHAHDVAAAPTGGGLLLRRRLDALTDAVAAREGRAQRDRRHALHQRPGRAAALVPQRELGRAGGHGRRSGAVRLCGPAAPRASRRPAARSSPRRPASPRTRARTRSSASAPHAFASVVGQAPRRWRHERARTSRGTSSCRAAARAARAARSARAFGVGGGEQPVDRAAALRREAERRALHVEPRAQQRVRPRQLARRARAARHAAQQARCQSSSARGRPERRLRRRSRRPAPASRYRGARAPSERGELAQRQVARRAAPVALEAARRRSVTSASSMRSRGARGHLAAGLVGESRAGRRSARRCPAPRREEAREPVAVEIRGQVDSITALQRSASRSATALRGALLEARRRDTRAIARSMPSRAVGERRAQRHVEAAAAGQAPSAGRSTGEARRRDRAGAASPGTRARAPPARRAARRAAGRAARSRRSSTSTSQRSSLDARRHLERRSRARAPRPARAQRDRLQARGASPSTLARSVTSCASSVVLRSVKPAAKRSPSRTSGGRPARIISSCVVRIDASPRAEAVVAAGRDRDDAEARERVVQRDLEPRFAAARRAARAAARAAACRRARASGGRPPPPPAGSALRP